MQVLLLILILSCNLLYDFQNVLYTVQKTTAHLERKKIE